ncbi:putative enoyl-CoA hydratase 1 [Rhodococcus erythropolis]|uniref:MaoC family dehydratase n=1 Tax=Rhodococcus erythropolis TaxID=1833 RepID=UPI000BB3A6E5|nr:MaoC family dehydratase [Rhodococcus erythropolis]PBI91954.1 putative enoyl-CoA hydratase 1 [Rhodococcus erythropolis]
MATFTYDSLIGTSDFDLGHSDWITIDQNRIDGFADVTDDHQWIHVDPERAAVGPFGVTVAHGYLTLSLVAPILEACFHVEDASMSVNYGINRARFPHPVRVGSRVRGQCHVLNVTSTDAGLDVSIGVTVQLEGVTKPACVADVVIRIMP